MGVLRWLNRLSRVDLFGPLERGNGRGGLSARGPRVSVFPPRFPLPEDGVVSGRGVRIGVGGEERLPDHKAGMEEERAGPVWCLNGPQAGLGDVSGMGGYLPDINSAVGFGSMLMRPRLYKGQLGSFCSLCCKPPPNSRPGLPLMQEGG